MSHKAILEGHFNPQGGEFTDTETGEKREFLNLDVSWAGKSSHFGVLPELRETIKRLASEDGSMMYLMIAEIEQKAIYGQAKGAKDTIVKIHSLEAFKVVRQKVEPAKSSAAAAS